MKSAWESSGGLFDPTVLASMTSLGYDADFDAVLARSALAGPRRRRPCRRHRAWPASNSTKPHGPCCLPRRVGVDPGAIGKGLAADIIVAELHVRRGEAAFSSTSAATCPSRGSTEDGSPWSDRRRGRTARSRRSGPADPALLEFPADTQRAGIATSTTLKRRWAQGRRHHVIDPRTGTMSSSDLVQVTVVADHAWEAEVTATTALLMTRRRGRPLAARARCHRTAHDRRPADRRPMKRDPMASISWTWLGIRASGITAWGLLTAVVLWGILLKTQLLGRLAPPMRLLDLHRWLGAIALAFPASCTWCCSWSTRS